jgi:hypothetical protein
LGLVTARSYVCSLARAYRRTDMRIVGVPTFFFERER